MKIIDYAGICQAPKGAVIALGLFDGVHLAHRELLTLAKETAESIGKPFGIFTFSKESGIKSNTKKLYSTDEKLELVSRLGADFAIVAGFSDISKMTPDEFVEKVLIGKLDASVAVSGYNFRFGKGALADAKMLKELMEHYGKAALIKDEIRESGEAVSATRIRALIEKGQIREANLLLGSPYFIRGTVVHGNGNGDGLGFPTLNVSLSEDKVTPRLGVYRSVVSVGGSLYNAVTNVGTCPTFGAREVHVEAHLIGVRENLYGKCADIYLLDFLREEKAFLSKEELILQISVDKNITIEKNGEEKWQELGLK